MRVVIQMTVVRQRALMWDQMNALIIGQLVMINNCLINPIYTKLNLSIKRHGERHTLEYWIGWWLLYLPGHPLCSPSNSNCCSQCPCYAGCLSWSSCVIPVWVKNLFEIIVILVEGGKILSSCSQDFSFMSYLKVHVSSRDCTFEDWHQEKKKNQQILSSYIYFFVILF